MRRKCSRAFAIDDPREPIFGKDQFESLSNYRSAYVACLVFIQRKNSYASRASTPKPKPSSEYTISFRMRSTVAIDNPLKPIYGKN